MLYALHIDQRYLAHIIEMLDGITRYMNIIITKYIAGLGIAMSYNNLLLMLL